MIVTPIGLESLRIAGQKEIKPDPADALLIATSGRAAVGVVKLCVDEAGAPSKLTILRTTGVSTYDQKIIHAMQGWRFLPFKVDGAAAPVCTAVTFVYRPVVGDTPPAPAGPP